MFLKGNKYSLIINNYKIKKYLEKFNQKIRCLARENIPKCQSAFKLKLEKRRNNG